MANFSVILKQLKKERDRAARTLARLNEAIAALAGPGSARNSPRRGGHRKMSASARRKIAAAQKARWAKWRAKKG